MTAIQTSNKKLQGQVFAHVKLDYTPEELQAMVNLYAETLPASKDGEIATGTVMRISGKNALLDFQGKATGVVPVSDLKDIPNLKIGDSVDVYVEKEENVHGELIVSRRSAHLIKAWKCLAQALETEEVLQGVVKRKITGGLVVDIMGIEVFLPGSQIDVSQVTDFDQFIGKIIEVVVAKIKKDKDNVVVSRKKIIEKEHSKQRKALLGQLEVGQILSGEVKNVTDYGVFIDLGGGITGLLYKGDIAYSKKVSKVSEMQDEQGQLLFDPKASPAQRIDVVVKRFDLDQGHIALSTKMLAWAALPEDIAKGQKIKVKVRDINDSFTLVEVAEGITGLLHISEMSHSNRIKNPKELIALDQEIEVEVLEIDREKQFLRVGMKQLQVNPWKGEAIKKYELNTRHTGKVCSITSNGAYLELEPAIEGFLSRNQMSWTQKVQDISTYIQEDSEVEVMVIGKDEEKKLLELSVRELQENPWHSFQEIFHVGSLHQGTIIKLLPAKGAIIELAYGVESFVPNKDLPKKVIIGDTHSFYVKEFLPEERKIILSQEATGTESKTKKVYNEKSKSPATLGDIEVLQKIKKELAEKDKKF